MSKTAKIFLIIATALVILGSAVFVVACSLAGWDFTKLDTKNYETNTYDITEEFTDISIKTGTANILFMPSDDEKCTVICYEEAKLKHSVSVEDGVLTVEIIDTQKWYDHIGISFGSSKITVYLPEKEYSSLKIDASTGDVKCIALENIGDVQITASTGDIHIDGLSASSLDVSVTTGKVAVTDSTVAGDMTVDVSTGKISLTEVACKNLISSGSTGDISLKNVIAAEKFLIQRSTGDVKFDGSDAAEIHVETSTGDVEGSLRSDKVFVVSTDTGNVKVPESLTGGKCKITTDTGDISVEIRK